MRKLVAALTARTPVLPHCIIPACPWRVRFLPTNSTVIVVNLPNRGTP